MFDIAIPQISPTELAARYEKVKPLVRFEDKLYYLREYTLEELSNQSFFFGRHNDKREAAPDSLIPMPEFDFPCLHTYGAPCFFKPSVAEVLAQLSEHDVLRACAFEIIEFPNDSGDFYKNFFTKMALNKGFHVSTVRLYRRKF